MLVSHYIAEEILQDWDNPKELEKKFRKFSERYPQDHEFQSIYAQFLKSKEDSAIPGEVKKRLEELRSNRKLESGGSNSMPFKDRRSMGDKPTSR